MSCVWMSTDLPSLGESDRMQAMVYGYDQLHRIVGARSLSTYGQNGLTRTDATDKYDTYYSYDPNEDRPLRKCPVDIFREGPGCRAGLTRTGLKKGNINILTHHLSKNLIFTTTGREYVSPG
ncbi:hypothetical protein [Cyclobacterium plantarum]|uniref:hypothetical protein n=1 Tax=Cyclobacterium plantarum TaxID=2716263 RepID=UPI003F6FE572